MPVFETIVTVEYELTLRRAQIDYPDTSVSFVMTSPLEHICDRFQFEIKWQLSRNPARVGLLPHEKL